MLVFEDVSDRDSIISVVDVCFIRMRVFVCVFVYREALARERFNSDEDI